MQQTMKNSVAIQDRIYSKDIFFPAVSAKVNVQAIVGKVQHPKVNSINKLNVFFCLFHFL